MYSSNNLKGVILACVSSAFIGSSFIIKKKGLKRAGSSGPRASVGGYGYLLEPLWWVGMVTTFQCLNWQNQQHPKFRPDSQEEEKKIRVKEEGPFSPEA